MRVRIKILTNIRAIKNFPNHNLRSFRLYFLIKLFSEEQFPGALADGPGFGCLLIVGDQSGDKVGCVPNIDFVEFRRIECINCMIHSHCRFIDKKKAQLREQLSL